MEKMKLYTGWTEEDISKDLRQKMDILNWMLKNKIEDVNQIGMIMAKYYIGSLVLE